MRNPGEIAASRKTSIFFVGGLMASAALLVGCSSSSSSGGGSATPSGTGTSLSPEARKFCAAVTTYYTSVAASNVQIMGKSGTREQIMQAFADWAPQAKDLVDTVPANAPANVKQAYQTNYTTMLSAAAGTATKEQATARTAASKITIPYESTVCPQSATE
ncbi:MAG: hypothetical protein WCP28_06955 [Actinomycetes bacterium]